MSNKINKLRKTLSVLFICWPIYKAMASEVPKVYFLKAFGHHGSGEGEFGGPFGIHVTKDRVYLLMT